MNDTSLPADVKNRRYNELLRDYQFMMSKSAKHDHFSNSQQYPPIKNINAPATLSNITGLTSSSSLTPATKKHTSSFAVRQLTPPSTSLKPENTPYIPQLTREEKSRNRILITPTSIN